MKVSPHIFFCHKILLLASCLALFAPAKVFAAKVQVFTPTGLTKEVRQVRVQFSEQVIPFGDPRSLKSPFIVSCGDVKGTARWADQKNWIYDFAEDLPAGVKCEFKINAEFKSLKGKALDENRLFSFYTGGPSIVHKHPYEGQELGEDPVLLLSLTAEPDLKSVMAHSYFAAEGVVEKVEIEILSNDLKEKMVGNFYRWEEKFKKDKENFLKKFLLLKAKRKFANGSRLTFFGAKILQL